MRPVKIELCAGSVMGACENACATRTPEEERELGALSVVLSTRSSTLAVEVWMAMEQLGGLGLDATAKAR